MLYSPYGKGNEAPVGELVRKFWESNTDQFFLWNPAWSKGYAKRQWDQKGRTTTEIYRLVLYEDGAFRVTLGVSETGVGGWGRDQTNQRILYRCLGLDCFRQKGGWKWWQRSESTFSPTIPRFREDQQLKCQLPRVRPFSRKATNGLWRDMARVTQLPLVRWWT